MLLCISMITALCGISAFAEDAAVAEVNGTQYNDLVEAFSAAKYGGEIKLLKSTDVVLTNYLEFQLTGDVILDLNNCNINFTGTATTAILVYAGYKEFKITGKGTITAEGRVLEVQSTGLFEPNVTIDSNVEIISKKEVALFVSTADAHVNVYGTVKSLAENAGAIMGNGNYKTGTGSITIHDGACVEAVNHAIYCPQGGSLNITGGTIKSKDTTAIEVRRGTLNISGNPTIETAATSYNVKKNNSGATTVGAAVAIAPYDEKEIKVNISGGTFKGVKALSYANPNEVANPDVTINVTGGTFSTAITDALSNSEVKSNFDKLAVVKDSNGYTYSVSDAAVASVGKTTYSSLEAAFAKAATGATITLLDNAKVYSRISINNGKKLTLNLNGKNVTSSDDITPFLVEGGELKVTGNGTVTSKLITFRSHANTNPKTMNESPLESILTIDSGVTVVSTGQCAVFYKGSGSVVNVYGTLEANGPYATISGNGSLDNTTNNGGTVLNIYLGAVIKSLGKSTTEARDNCAIYHPQSGTINVEGGELSSQYGSGIEMRDGTLNISGGTITSYAGEFTCTPNSNGATTKGAAVAIAMHPNGNRAAKVNITGGKLTAPKALAYSNPNNAKNPDVTINVTGGTFSTAITDALTNAEVKSNFDKLAVVKDSNGYTYSVSDAVVAEVGGEKYASLEAAFAKAATGATITLLDNAKVYSRISINNGKKLTLDLNGHNITNNGCGVFQIYNGKLDVTGKGKIETTGSYLPFSVQSNKTNSEEKIDSVLTIGEKVEVISNDYCAIFYVGNGAVVNVRGTVNALGENAAIQGNGQYSVKDNNNWGRTTLNIYPGAVVTANLTTIYHPQFGGEVNVTGGVITSKDACAIEMRDGELNVSGDAVIETKATKFEYASNNNGSTTRGAAVAAALYQDRIISINISGGTYKGVKALSYENPNSVVNPDVTITVTGGTFSTDITDALTNAEVKSNIKEYAVAANDDGTYGVKARDEKFEKVAAVQRTGSKTLTFLAGINYLDYEKAGFRVTVGNNTKEVSTGTVYTKLDNNGKTSVSVDDFKTNYFFAADFEVLDTSITEFTITPFAKLLNGEEVTGKSTTVKVEKTGGAE